MQQYFVAGLFQLGNAFIWIRVLGFVDKQLTELSNPVSACSGSWHACGRAQETLVRGDHPHGGAIHDVMFLVQGVVT
jgi:hypothetical protein